MFSRAQGRYLLDRDISSGSILKRRKVLRAPYLSVVESVIKVEIEFECILADQNLREIFLFGKSDQHKVFRINYDPYIEGSSNF